MSLRLRPLFILFLVCAAIPALAQLGGQTSFRLLDIPSSARSAALGGNYIAVKDADLNLGIFNPGLLNKEMDRQLALSYLPYMDGVSIGYMSYGHHLDSTGITLSGTMQYVDYGTMTRRDELGNEMGEFKPGEYVIQAGAGMPIDSLFSVGANVKMILSSLESYTSTAFALDIGGVFSKPSKGITVAAMLRNMGSQTSTFTEEREKLPFQVQLGVTYKFKHAPFRLGLMIEELQQWDLTYDDPNKTVEIDPSTGDVIVDKVTTFDKTLLHLVPSAEILLSENFMLRLAYNFRTRQEMALAEKPSITGLSFGLGLKVSRFHISYGYSQIHLAGISNTITIGVRFADFKRVEG